MTMKSVRGAVAFVVTAIVASGLAAAAGARAQALPAKQIQAIVGENGAESSGVLDLAPSMPLNVHLHGVEIDPAFQLNADLEFQAEKNGDAFFNGDVPVHAADMNRVIDAILGNHLVFQAEHQHFYDFSPMVWFVHFRGLGAPATVAAEVHAVLVADRMPLGQSPPKNPRTPFNWRRIKSILGASSATTDEDGVVTFSVDRKKAVDIGGIRANKELNVQTTISFEPLDKSGTRAAVAPDFDMSGAEVDPVISTMRSQGWDIGCLYNQETNESPQLYFSHDFKTGDPYVLAAEVRRGLDKMNVEH
jgi:hypothetical protein